MVFNPFAKQKTHDLSRYTVDTPIDASEQSAASKQRTGGKGESRPACSPRARRNGCRIMERQQQQQRYCNEKQYFNGEATELSPERMCFVKKRSGGCGMAWSERAMGTCVCA